MSFALVETTEPKRQLFVDSAGGKSTSTLGHAVWRCCRCRALAVTDSEQYPPDSCGKCHR